MPKKVTSKKVTNAKDWRASTKVGVLVELPSGKVARLVRPHLLALVDQGLIPDPLSAQVMEIMQDEKTAARATEILKAEEIMQVVDITIKAAFVEPRVTDDPGEDEISPADIDVDDKTYVFWWCQGGINDLSTFREQQSRVMETLLAGDQVQSKTKRSSRRK